MVRTRPKLPYGHGELLTRPEFARWAGIVEATAGQAEQWDAPIADTTIKKLRTIAREEIVRAAGEFSARLGDEVSLRSAATSSPQRLVMTGHQPDLYHPGVWAKTFLLQRLSEEAGALAINLVVDSDTFDTVGINAPCLDPEVRRCTAYLAVGGEGVCYGYSPVPGPEAVDQFCRAGEEMLGTLPTPALSRHFTAFCNSLRSAGPDASNLAELITFARRRYEASARTDYLELPVTEMARAESFRRFAAHIALDADRFAQVHNDALDDFREATGIRTPVQPFPNLDTEDGWVELPFWAVDRESGSVEGRTRLFSRREEGGDASLRAGDVRIELGASCASAAEAILDAGLLVLPRAITLTMFVRLLLADLFIHGVGGGSYDRVTDDVIRAYLDIEPPPFVVASLTMYLPLGGHVVTDEEIAEARQVLNTLEHNPDQMLADVSFDSAEERLTGTRLAEEKAALIKAISEPGADKKTIGRRIREVNEELVRLLEPVRAEWTAELSRLEGLKESSEILTDRTYPFCFWSPEEVQDKTG